MTVEIWATDEHRIGLKPITRGVWAPIGERPVAVGHHRFEWLYVTGFVEPTTGRTVWNVSNNISKAYFELVLADFARSVGGNQTGSGSSPAATSELQPADIGPSRRPSSTATSRSSMTSTAAALRRLLSRR